MNWEQHDLAGRTIAQHFFTELEKIARHPLSGLVQRGAKSSDQLTQLKGHLGLKRFLPGSMERSTWRAAKGQTASIQQDINKQLMQRRQDAMALIRAGGDEERAMGLQLLNELRDVNAPTSDLQALRRQYGLGGGELKAPPGIMGSPMARKAMMGGGLAAAGAGGLYAGQQYLANQQAPQGYY